MATAQKNPQSRIQLQVAAQACEDKKGQDTRILELDPVDSGLADFFLITSATNERQSVAIADEIEFRLKKQFGLYASSVEGRRRGEWILLDYVDFVVHVFLAERRDFYDIERLRKSARPLTPAEFDAELKSALVEKTRSSRSKTTEKPAPAKKSAAAKKVVAKKAVTPKTPAKKAVAKKKVVAVKKVVAKKTAVKKTTKKTAVKKVIAKKTVASKAPAKKAVAKKATKKAAVNKAAIKKVVAKKTTKKAIVKKVVAKKAVTSKSSAKKVVAKKATKKATKKK